MSTNTELPAIAGALDALLTAIAQQPRLARPLGLTLTVDDLANTTAAAEVAEEIIADPIGRSLRLGIEALGMRLNEIGGAKAMHDAMDDVIARAPGREDWRTNILDKRWDGIGEWLA